MRMGGEQEEGGNEMMGRVLIDFSWLAGPMYRIDYLLYYDAPHCNSILTAIATHARATYGDKRSPGMPCVSELRSAVTSFCEPIRADLKIKPRNLHESSEIENLWT